MKFLVVGDVCEDVYHVGSTDRKNPEASAILLNSIETTVRRGMAANVAENLQALGAEVDLVVPEEPWIQKHRYIDRKHGTQLLRVDYDHEYAPYKPTFKQDDLKQYDGIVLSDYNKGFVSEDVLLFFGRETHVFLDSKKPDVTLYAGLAYLKVNESEYAALIDKPRDAIVTLGHRGSRTEDYYSPAVDIDVVDVCGAGDTFLAAFAWQMVQHGDKQMSLDFANAAAAVTCQHRGAYAPTLNEIHY